MTFNIPPATNNAVYPWPLGTYRVALISLEREQETNAQYTREGQARIRWSFECVRVLDSVDRRQARDLKLADELLLAWTNLSMSRRSIFRQWAEVLVGRALAEGEVIEPGQLLGKTARAVVAEYDKRDGTKGVGIRVLQPDVADDDDDAVAVMGADAPGTQSPNDDAPTPS
jgi:hypothetical protein